MAPPKLKLYMDVVSPFGYIAYHILRTDPIFSKCEITYVPIFLGGVMKACGNTPPINIKTLTETYEIDKDKYTDKSRKLLAKLFSVPMKETMIEGFPPMTLNVMRALCALTVIYPDSETGGQKSQGKGGQEVLIKVFDELLTGLWVRHERVHEKEVFASIFERVIGKEKMGEVLEMIPKEGKAVLQKNTDKSLEEGAFGLPYFVATTEGGESEGFWGVDSLGFVGQYLGLEGLREGSSRKGAWKSLL